MQNILQLQKALDELSAKAPTPPFAADQNIFHSQYEAFTFSM